MTVQTKNSDVEETSSAPAESPLPTDAVPTVSTDELDAAETAVVLVEMLMKTGSARLGAETLIGKATDNEKAGLFDCVRSEDNVLEISDSKACQKAMTKFAQRLADEQKTSVEYPDEE